jgi:hypothetical protein
MDNNTTAIFAKDFYETGDNKAHRDTWKPGALRHVIAALAGTPVLFVQDSQTGFTVVGVKLTGIGHTSGGGETLQYAFPDGTRGACLIFGMGTVIIPMEQIGAKWDALSRSRQEASLAQQIYRERVGKLEKISSSRVRSLAHGVHVSRYVRKEYSNGKGTYEEMADWGSVSVQEIRAAADCGDCLQRDGRHEPSCAPR